MMTNSTIAGIEVGVTEASGVWKVQYHLGFIYRLHQAPRFVVSVFNQDGENISGYYLNGAWETWRKV